MEKFEYVIFIFVYMMVIGLVSSAFNPDMYSFGEEDYVTQSEIDTGDVRQTSPEDPSLWEKITGFFGGVFNVLGSIFTFMWAGLTLNIPNVPLIIKIALCSPMWVGLGYIIMTNLNPLSSD